MREFDIDHTRFVETALGRNLSDCKIIGYDHAYLDCETGEIIWIYRDEEKAKLYLSSPKKRKKDSLRKERIKERPERYLVIPGRTIEEHKEILVEFLDSEWTLDIALRKRAKATYNGSLSFWKRVIDDGYVLSVTVSTGKKS